MVTLRPQKIMFMRPVLTCSMKRPMHILHWINYINTSSHLQIMLRFLVWNDVVEIDTHKVGLGWKLVFNFTYYTSILANWTLVWLAAERLVSVAWPDQVKIYLTNMRARLNIILQVNRFCCCCFF